MGFIFCLIIVNLLIPTTLANICESLPCSKCISVKECKFIIPFLGVPKCVHLSVIPTISIQAFAKTEDRCLVYNGSFEGSPTSSAATILTEYEENINNEIRPPTEVSHVASSSAVLIYPRNDPSTTVNPSSPVKHKQNLPRRNMKNVILKFESTGNATPGNYFSFSETLDSITFPSTVANYSCPTDLYIESKTVKTVRNICRGKDLQSRLLKIQNSTSLDTYFRQNPTTNRTELCNYLKWMRHNCM